MIRIQPYHNRSISARKLGEHIGVLLATPQQKRKYKDFDHVINWGSGREDYTGEYINKPANVRKASNKLSTFKALARAGVGIPAFTSDKRDAIEWLREGRTVVERKLLHGSKGRGLRIVCGEGAVLRDAPLYTEYVKKQDEYRVHVFRGEVIDVQQKRKKREVPNDEVNYQVRNYHNGWVFCRDGIDVPDGVIQNSIAAVDALGLDFGGVDIGYNRKHNKAVVFEVNTAPGIEGTTLLKYFEAFRKALPELNGGMFRRRRHGEKL